MRRVAAVSMLLLLLLHSPGAAVALAQVPAGDTHAHCATAATADTGAHSLAHSSPSDDAASGGHCTMPWMTNCGAASACSGQPIGAAQPAAPLILAGTTASRPRDRLVPDSPSTELEAPPPRG